MSSLRPAAVLLAALYAVLLVGCATPTLSKNQCIAGDWRGIGFDDGREGFAPTRISRHTEACEETGIIPDSREYRAGWNEGVRGFCTWNRGLLIGREGSSYHGLCPPDLEPAFMRGYQQGLHDFCVPARAYDDGRMGSVYRGGVCPPHLEFAFRQAFEHGQEVQRARAHLNAIESEHSSLTRQLAHAKTDKEKDRINNRLRHLHEEHRRATNSLFFLEGRVPGPWLY